MTLVERSKSISIWLHERIDGLAVRSDERTRVVGGCFDMVLEHQQAVTILVENKLYGSAFALARSAFEAHIRGIWLRDCATDEQWKKYIEDDFRVPFQMLIDDVESLEDYATGVLAAAKKSAWPLFNSFTHTGYNQVVRRNSEDYIESNYSDEDIKVIVEFVNSTSLLAGLEIIGLATTKLEVVQQEFVQKMKEFVDEKT